MSAATVLADLKARFGQAWHVKSDSILDYLSTSLAKISDVTAGTVLASSAVVVDASKNISSFNNVGLAGTLTFGAGGQIDVDSSTTTAAGTGGTSTATLSKMAGVITTDAITTASLGQHVMTVTNTLVAAGDIVLVSLQGGTNTRDNIQIEAVAGSGTITVTLTNNHASAVNGTVIFAFVLLKA